MNRRHILRLLAGTALAPFCPELPALSEPTGTPIAISGGTGTGATAIATVRAGAIWAITVTASGSGYSPDGPLTITLGRPRQISRL